MPYKRPRTTNKCHWSNERMKLAIKAFQDGREGIRSAARRFEVPVTSLYDRIKKGVFYEARMGRTTTFTEDQENEIVQHLLKLSKMFYGLTPLQFRRAVFSYAEKMSIPHKFNKSKQEAGKDWMYGFMERHPRLSFRKPEATSINRIRAFNKEDVGRFFKNLEMLMSKYHFHPTRIFNVDETGITTVNRPNRIIGPKGQKQIGAATSGERGKNITVCCCMSASGSFTPSMFIYPRIRMTPVLQKGGPPGSIYTCTKSGWMTEEAFCTWLHHFANNNHPSKEDPVLLILDNHSSHISLTIYEFCRENGIILLSIPPHTSHRLQPLDLTLFSSLKQAYDRQCDLYLKSHPYEKITISDVNALFTKAYMKIINGEKAAAGFEKAGIYEMNPNVFDESDFYHGDVEDGSSNLNERSTEPVAAIPEEPIPGCSKDPDLPLRDESFEEIVPVPKPRSMKKSQKGRKKQKSEILTSSPFKTDLEEKEKRRKMKEKLENEKLASKGSKKTQKSTKLPANKKPTVRKVFETSSTSGSEVDPANICDDDELDDVEPENMFQDNNDGEVCLICGEYGKSEIWFRCIACGGWTHKLCSGAEQPDNYLCDFCKMP